MSRSFADAYIQKIGGFVDFCQFVDVYVKGKPPFIYLNYLKFYR